MLTCDGQAGYVHEPFNPNNRDWHGGLVRHWFTHVASENEASFFPWMNDLLAGRYPLWSRLKGDLRPSEMYKAFGDWRLIRDCHRRSVPLLLKDPIAIFSAEWLADRFDCRVLLLVRHPLAFVGSILRRGWNFGFRHWIDQPALLNSLLAPYADAVHQASDRRTPVIDRAILMWNCFYDVVRQYQERHPEWLVCRYEDFAYDPICQFKQLYAKLGLQWTDRAEEIIAGHSLGSGGSEPSNEMEILRSSRAAAETWKQRLTAKEIDHVLNGVGDVASRFYSDEELKNTVG